MEIYIVALLIALILVSILFFALRSTVKRIDHNTKKYFVDKLQDYDYLIEEKQQVIDKLNKEIEENKKVLDKLKNTKISKDNKMDTYYYDNNIPKYTDDKLFEKYKNIKEKFSIDVELLLNDFISNKLTDDSIDYEILLNIRKKLSNKVIYEIMNLKKNEQLQRFNTIVDNDEFKTIKKYINMDKFNINRLVTDMDTILEKLDPLVYVFTGEKGKKYEHISPKINTIYDKRINEGIKISYKGDLYDYSL